MSETPPDPRDLRLARRLDQGARPDGADPLHDALEALVPRASSDVPEAARLWARVEADITPARAPDRPPLRLVRTVRRIAVAAAVVVAIGLGVWWIQSTAPVAVAQAEIVEWTAPDGSAFVLRPHSELVRLGERAYRLEGEAYVAVAHDPAHPFTVEAGPGTVRVLGTRFVVATDGRGTDVFVEEGRVEVTAAASAVVLGAGEGAVATANGVVEHLDATAETALDWRSGVVAFDGAPAAEVAAEIGRHFGVAVAVPTPLAREMVSGTLDLTTAAEALGQLARILEARVVPSRGGFRIEP